MEDKVKQFRDQHQVLDMAAGFIPGVGEALDVHDLYHAIKKRDFSGIGLALAGLAIPGLTAALFKALGDLLKFGSKKSKTLLKDYLELFDPRVEQTITPVLSEKGFRIEGDWILNKEGKRMRRYQTTVKDESTKNTKKIPRIAFASEDRYNESIKNLGKHIDDLTKKDVEFQKRLFNNEAEIFRKKTNFPSFHTDQWLSGIPEDYRIEKKYPKAFQYYINTGGRLIMNNYDTLIKNGKNHDGKSWALRPNVKNGKIKSYDAFFPELLDVLGDKHKAGWRTLGIEDAEDYLILTSPNYDGKLMNLGIHLQKGVPAESLDYFLKEGNTNGWYSSEKLGAAHYAKDKTGLSYNGSPIISKENQIQYIRGSGANPSSTHWNSAGNNINAHLPSSNSHAIMISERPLLDTAAKTTKPGYFLILGQDVRSKALRGGSGLVDLNEVYPLLKNGGIIGVNKILGIK